MNETGRILCVDDEEGVLHALRRVFFDEPVEVLTAASGEEGLRILEAAPAQVVVSDYRMPGMNGVAFLREVSARRPDTMRILLSGYSDIKAVIEAINEGRIYKFISKPWNDDELRIAVTNAFKSWRLARRNVELTQQLQTANEELQTLNAILQERITDEVVALRKRAGELERAAAALDVLPLAVACLDHDGWLTYYNDAASALFSWTVGAMRFVPHAKAFPVKLDDLLAEVSRSGGASLPLVIRGKTVLARAGRTAGPDKPGVVLIFEEYPAEAERRTA